MTERKRASGFVLMDAAFAADAKFVRLARLTNPVEFAACVGVWWMLLADCRRAKSPDVDWDDYTEYAEQIDLLLRCKLLNEGGFEPESFSRWAPAYRSVTEVRSGTVGYGAPPKSTLTSGQVISGQVPPSTNGTRARETFMGFVPPPPVEPTPPTPEQIDSYRRFATTASDPLVASNARKTLERLGIPLEEAS